MNRMNPNTNSTQINLTLAKEISRGSLYASLTLGLSGVGFIVIYYLAQSGLLGASTPQLLYLGAVFILFAISQIPIQSLGRNGRGIAAYLLSSLLISIFTVLAVFIWEGIAFIATVIVVVTYSRIILLGIPRRYLLATLAIKATGITGIFFANQYPFILKSRLETNTPAVIAALTFLVATAILLTTIAVLSGSRRFKNLRSQLLLSSVIIVSIPTIMTAVLSAVGGYVNIETQALDTLETVSNLKINQLNVLITSFENDIAFIQADNEFRVNVLSALLPSENPSTSKQRNIDAVRSRLEEIQIAKEIPFDEIMVLDIKGNVLISTNPENEGTGYQSEIFYRQGYLAPYLGFSDEPIHGDSNFFISAPIFEDNNKKSRGALVLRVNGLRIKDVIEKTPGYEAAETYLLDKDLHPITKTRIPVDVVRTRGSISASMNNLTGQRGIYDNYSGETVLGYFRLFRSLDAIFITELPRSVVIEKSIGTFIASSALALFAIVLAISAVVITANLTVEPITSLVNTARDFATGKLTSRVDVDRKDEIGILGMTYNQMAKQLQDLISQLETRVVDRTAELDAALRQSDKRAQDLQAISEISRTISTEQRLDILLNLITRLVSDRFGFYHIGIFIVDETRRYAYLQAANSEGGQRMLARGHRLEIGKGLVGTVAQTGKARIALDVGSDAVFFNNPDLPETHSEMALPLEVRGQTIGVMDVQSTEPGAFTQNDANTLGILADQVAIAIENARLFNQTQQAKDEAEALYAQIQRQEWSTLIKKGTRIGYHQTATGGKKLEKQIDTDEIREALENGRIVVLDGEATPSTNQPAITVPVRLRGQTIGVLNIKAPTRERKWNQDEINLAQAISDRLALALDNARLFEETSQRAERERLVSEITSKIRSHNDPQAMIETAMQELRNALGATRVEIVPKTSGGKDKV